MQIKPTAAFVTTDGKQFFNQEEARQHERTTAFERLYANACRANPQFARLDRALILAFVKVHGVEIGKIAGDPIPVSFADGGLATGPQPGPGLYESVAKRIEARDEMTPALREVVKHPALATPYRPTLAQQEARAREILKPVEAPGANLTEPEVDLDEVEAEIEAAFGRGDR